MNSKSNDLLYNKVTSKNFTPKHVAEVGVWHPKTSNVYLFIKDNIKTTLVEPDPKSISLIKKEFSNDTNVSLIEAALCDYNGEIDLYKRESSTFVTSLPSSPALVNDNIDLNKTDKFTAKAKKMNEIDDGSIDIISIDTEGSEWFVIKNMISRPTILSIETHGGAYKNPYINEINNWLQVNNYTLWYKDKSDSVFIFNNKLPVTIYDKLKLIGSSLLNTLKSIKKKSTLIRRKLFTK